MDQTRIQPLFCVLHFVGADLCVRPLRRDNLGCPAPPVPLTAPSGASSSRHPGPEGGSEVGRFTDIGIECRAAKDLPPVRLACDNGAKKKTEDCIAIRRGGPVCPPLLRRYGIRNEGMDSGSGSGMTDFWLPPARLACDKGLRTRQGLGFFAFRRGGPMCPPSSIGTTWLQTQRFRLRRF
jgi:hypothetical protein